MECNNTLHERRKCEVVKLVTNVLLMVSVIHVVVWNSGYGENKGSNAHERGCALMHARHVFMYKHVNSEMRV